jgi:hypothetical protein
VELGLVLLLFWLPAAMGMWWLVRKEWMGTWRGHRITVRNHLLTEQLFIDDRLVASTPAGPRAGSVLTGSIDDRGQHIPVMATLVVGLGRLDVQLIVNGEVVPTITGRIGALESEVPRALIEAGPEPSDPRWNAAMKLLDSIRAQDAAPDLAALCLQVQSQLRQILLDIEALDQDAEAHRQLAAPDGQAGSKPTLEAVRHAKEAQLRALLAAVQKLHLAILSGKPSGEATSLAAKLSARVEVETTRPETEAKRAGAQAIDRAAVDH